MSIISMGRTHGTKIDLMALMWDYAIFERV